VAPVIVDSVTLHPKGNGKGAEMGKAGHNTPSRFLESKELKDKEVRRVVITTFS
jgi:hypothetical protein